MFTATNQEHLSDFLDATSISGGFIARTLIIKADRKARINSLISNTEQEDENIELLDLKPFSNFLKQAENLKGKFRLTNDFREVWNIWYKEFQEQLENENKDITGISERVHDHILKTCMLLAVSKNLSMVITPEIFEEAKEIVLQTAGDTQRVVAGNGKGELSAGFRLLMDDLLSAPEFKMARAKILSKRYGSFDANDLDRMIETLSQSKMVEIIRNANGPVYKLTEPCIRQFTTLLKKSEQKSQIVVEN
jgi:hypothetical protein